MNVQYDVKVPRNTYGNKSVYADAFWEFYDSEHKTVKMEYESVQKAMKAQKSICMLISRHQIFDVKVTRRENVLYAVRSVPDDNY